MADIRSKRGKDKYTEGGHSYRFDKFSADGRLKFWRCDRKRVCKARIHTADGRVVKRMNDHTHPGDAAHLEVQKAVTSLKERAANTQDSTGQVVAAAVANLSQAGQGALPDIRYMKRTVQRVRVATAAVPPNPGRLTDLVIPGEYTYYEKNPGVFEDFLQHDSGPASGDDRMLIFSTERNLDILSHATDWAMDGTFDAAPMLFTQVYSIHATFMERTLPLVYALLPNKNQLGNVPNPLRQSKKSNSPKRQARKSDH